MTDQPPKIIFPCEYPIKVLGRACEAFQPTVLAIFRSRAGEFDSSGVVVKDSRKDTFQSITITIEAKSEEQLTLIHKDLMDTGLVSMVI